MLEESNNYKKCGVENDTSVIPVLRNVTLALGVFFSHHNFGGSLLSN